MTRITSFATLPELLEERARTTPAAVAFMEKNPAGRWRATTWEQFHKAVRHMSHDLWRAGLRPGDHVAVMLPNSVRWEIVQHAVYRVGGIVVGLDRNDPAERLADLFACFDAKALIADDRGLLPKIPAATLGALKLVRTDPDPPPAKAPQSPGPPPALDAVTPDRTATLIFTSGTTGRPKALTYSHGQLALAIASVTPLLADLPDQAHAVCWLPLANPFQRMTNWCAMAANWKSFIVSDPSQILAQAREIRPHFLVAVPRFYEKFAAGIQQRLGGLPDRLVLRRARRAMGGRLRYFISGSAPLSATLIDRFAALGWPILEAYGISENIVPMAMNAPGAYRPGSVGRPLGPNAIRIAGDGEILVKGPGLSIAAADSEPDGFLRTGDLGFLDQEGFLRITGRKSDLFKLSTGRKIVPRALEEALGRVEGVAHGLVAGRNHKVVVALLNVPEAPWRRLRERHGGPEGACRYLRDQARMACAHLPDYSRPVAVAVIHDTFTPQSGELTANLKLRRDFVLNKHAAAIEAIYRRIEGD